MREGRLHIGRPLFERNRAAIEASVQRLAQRLPLLQHLKHLEVFSRQPLVIDRVLMAMHREIHLPARQCPQNLHREALAGLVASGLPDTTRLAALADMVLLRSN